ncbi:hypothetical protein P168DRAFT_124740 [Aspergillus campestris IBT 28561]|uniref:Uncharacterized protein n=1 Tax=Aspergillus campestris (strain IBT 28561) TaxID=1392248 RepID=A0A2I1D6I0_ASPC2|nr:uncharacterized protein P168DRAFT_124740 [Aspergillus campestris IBT 28561]PKY05475.1 hypothetical protein P168DRAFT_124740 [Aspergillus campestris IBT 28561]
MPRTLPWLVPKSEHPDPAPRRQPVKREKTTTTPKREDKSLKRNFLRSSPSPPSSPVHHCPSEEYLIEGLPNDDIYMMVEDELHSIAQDFTRHLHHQEYIKQRKEVKLRNQAAIGDLARATAPSLLGEKGLAAAGLSGDGLGKEKDKGKRVRGVELDEDDEGDDCFVGTSLHGLMMSPRRGPSLVGARGVRSFTRAAAGFSQASGGAVTTRGADDGGPVSSPLRRGVVGQGGEETASEGDDDDDDDLDVQPDSPTRLRRPVRPVKLDPSMDSSPPRVSLTPRPRDTARDGSTTSRGSEPTKPRVGKATTRTRTKTQNPKRKSIFDDFDELPELSEPDHTPSPSIETAQRHIHQRDTEKKQSRLNEVPTFLL